MSKSELRILVLITGAGVLGVVVPGLMPVWGVLLCTGAVLYVRGVLRRPVARCQSLAALVADVSRPLPEVVAAAEAAVEREYAATGRSIS